MSYEKTDIPNLLDGEQGYTLTSEPCQGALVAVSASSRPQLDGEGHFVALHLQASGRWVDETGEAQAFPGHGAAVTANMGETNHDGTATHAGVIDSLLEGVEGNPKPLPSPMRRAIAAAQAMEANE